MTECWLALEVGDLLLDMVLPQFNTSIYDKKLSNKTTNITSINGEG